MPPQFLKPQTLTCPWKVGIVKRDGNPAARNLRKNRILYRLPFCRFAPAGTFPVLRADRKRARRPNRHRNIRSRHDLGGWNAPGSDPHAESTRVLFQCACVFELCLGLLEEKCALGLRGARCGDLHEREHALVRVGVALDEELLFGLRRIGQKCRSRFGRWKELLDT